MKATGIDWQWFILHLSFFLPYGLIIAWSLGNLYQLRHASRCYRTVICDVCKGKLLFSTIGLILAFLALRSYTGTLIVQYYSMGMLLRWIVKHISALAIIKVLLGVILWKECIGKAQTYTCSVYAGENLLGEGLSSSPTRGNGDDRKVVPTNERSVKTHSPFQVLNLVRDATEHS